MHKRILVVDSSRILRMLLAVSFRKYGHEVFCCTQYEEGRETLARLRKQPPDLLFVALHTSTDEGVEFIGWLRRQPFSWNMPIVAMMTAEECTHRRVQPLLHNREVMPFLKPFRVQEAMSLLALATPRTLRDGVGA